jgi:hypothetical protein
MTDYTYITTFTYDGEEYGFEDEQDYSLLWELAEIGPVELFDTAGVDYPEDFDYDLFEGPYSQPVDSD